MENEDITQSKTFKKWGTIAGGSLVVVIAFSAGVFVGQEKARFSYKWGENYYRNFVGFMPPAMPGIPTGIRLPSDRDYMNAHGVLGKVIKINGNMLAIKDDDGAEKNIIADSETIFMRDRDNIKLGDIKVNDNTVIIGSPDGQGQMEAKFVRVLKIK